MWQSSRPNPLLAYKGKTWWGMDSSLNMTNIVKLTMQKPFHVNLPTKLWNPFISSEILGKKIWRTLELGTMHKDKHLRQEFDGWKLAHATTLKFFIFCIFHSSCFLWFVWNMDGWLLLRCLGCLVHASINNQQFEFWLTKWICCPLFSWPTVFWNLHPTLLFGPVRFALAFNNFFCAS
jgi:hypothetical protein